MLQHATRQAPPTRGGRLWRMLVGEQDEPQAPVGRTAELEPDDEVTVYRRPTLSEAPAIESIGPPDVEAVYRRVQRLETGIRLMAEAFRRAYGDLAGEVEGMRAETSAAIERVRATAELAPTRDDVRRLTTEAMEPVTAALGEIAERSASLPVMLLAAVDRLVERVDDAQVGLEESMIALLPVPWDGPPSNGAGASAVRSAAAPAAADIWGS